MNGAAGSRSEMSHRISRFAPRELRSNLTGYDHLFAIWSVHMLGYRLVLQPRHGKSPWRSPIIFPGVVTPTDLTDVKCIQVAANNKFAHACKTSSISSMGQQQKHGTTATVAWAAAAWEQQQHGQQQHEGSSRMGSSSMRGRAAAEWAAAVAWVSTSAEGENVREVMKIISTSSVFSIFNGYRTALRTVGGAIVCRHRVRARGINNLQSI